MNRKAEKMLACALILGGIHIPFLHAQQPTPIPLQIAVESDIDAAGAVGLIITESDTIQVPGLVPESPRPGFFIVSVPVDTATMPPGAMVSALVMSKDGRVAFGQMRAINPNQPPTSYVSLPDCPPEKISETSMQGQISVIQKITENRLQRRANAQVRVAQLLDESFLQLLRTMEEKFGLRYVRPLEADSPPVELIDRLSRLVAVIESLQRPKGNASKSATVKNKPANKR